MSRMEWALWFVCIFSVAAIEIKRPMIAFKNRNWLAVLLLSAICISIFVAFVYRNDIESKGTQRQIDWLLLGFMFASMILGMVSQFFYFKEKGTCFDKSAFARPFFASPIVFIPLAAAFQGSGSEESGWSAPSLMILLASFQNGFFWKTVFDKQHTQLGGPKP